MNIDKIKSLLDSALTPAEASSRWGLHRSTVEEMFGASTIPKDPTMRLEFISFKEMINRQVQTDWLIKGYFDRQSIILLFGETGSMKSFVAIDIGLCVATCTDWHGHAVKQSGPVFYICGEGFSGVSKRLKGWKIKHEGTEDPVFCTSSTSIDLSDPDCVQQVVAIIHAMSTEHGPPSLVIVDTLNRNFGGGDENSTSDMTRFISGLDRLRHELETAIMVVHHTGLSDKQRSRGSSALKAAVDSEYRLDVVGDTRKLTCTKMKDHEPPEPMFFLPEVVNLGFIESDDPDDLECATSVVLNLSASQNTSAPPPPKLTHPQQLVLDTLRELCHQAKNHRAYIDQWKEASLQKSISDTSKDNSKSKAFKRCREALLTKGYVDTDADFYWVRT